MKSDKKPTVLVVLETRPNKDNLFAVALKVTFDRTKQLYRLKYPNGYGFKQPGATIYLSKDEFADCSNKTKKRELKELQRYFEELKTEVYGVIDSMPFFTFEQFQNKYFHKSDKSDLFFVLKERSKELRAEGRVSTAVTFECTLNSLKKYHTKDTLKFELVTPQFLKEYESHMLKAGKSYSSIGIYLRNVRTMFNNSEIHGLLYPFGESKGLYRIPTGQNIKKALDIEQIFMIVNYEPLEYWETLSRDLWVFSYLSNGMNIKDIARLKYSNINSDVIRFVRAKTQRSKKNQKFIEIPITERIGRILDLHGSKGGYNDYIFNILTKDMNPEQEYRAVQQMTANVNHNMKRIAAKLGIESNVTSYTARHSFASQLKRQGVSTEYIQEALGHTSKDTTENYLASFEIGQKRKMAGLLLPENL